ncbi:MAG: dipeptidase [Candidatus Caldarchaeum sp.]|nr:dipeptidase [Candidatus Caldarchaeum sp.]
MAHASYPGWPPPLVDLHEDISLYYFLGGHGLRFKPADFGIDLPERHGDIPKYRKANARLIFSAIAPTVPTISDYRLSQLSSGYGMGVGAFRTRSPLTTALEHVKIYYNLLFRHNRDLRLVRNREDVKDVERVNGRIGFLMALEGAEPLEDVEDIDLFYALGVRSLQLTWNFDNKYAASCMSKRDYGLTGDGEELIKRCNELGVIVDLAHASRKTALEAIEVSRLPVIISHANTSAVHQHVRNVDDETLEKLKRNNGVIGVTCIEPTIGREATCKKLADHIIHVYQTIGCEHIALGTDYFGLLNMREPEGLEDITKIDNLWKELFSRGLSEEEVAKIAYRNIMRVVEANARKWVDEYPNI